MSTTPSTKEAAQETAATAADETKHVAGVATEEAKKVASEAADHARSLLDEAMSQVDEQTRTQRDRLVSTLGTFGDDLRQMAEQSGTPGLANDLARQVADRASSLTSQLDGREPGELLDEVRAFARRRPGMFLVGAVAAGVVAGRFARGAKQAKDQTSPSSQQPGTMPLPPPTPAPTPYVETGLPTVGQPQSTAPISSDPLRDPLSDPLSDPLGDPLTDGGRAVPGTPANPTTPGYTP